MQGIDMIQKIQIDGEKLGEVLQIIIDQEQTTVAYNTPAGKRRTITVETEAVSFGNA